MQGGELVMLGRSLEDMSIGFISMDSLNIRGLIWSDIRWGVMLRVRKFLF
jgi:hypothetical protein